MPSDTSKQQLLVITLALAALLAPQGASAQGGERSGKAVVEATCASCHAKGENGAPRIGDRKAWATLAQRGLSSLTESALAGIRKMPPHGANLSLTDTEIKRGIAYMVNQSGGKWVEPTSRTAKPAPRTGQQIVNAQCVKCHEKGTGGAPKIGDREAWIPRLKNGLDPLVQSAVNGHGGMPPRGGAANLSDAELKDAITYMFNKGRVPESTAK
ncbi:MAG: cytochrome c5 family protein [Proteobacteria bacterium]|nr:cytochrome c5 family protein [Pseudomonadota bacterium]